MPEVPGYRFESKMAEGGMGVVYRAVDETLGRTVAVKMIRHGLLGPGDERTETVSRFLREARAAAQIQSNHVAHVLQFGETEAGDLFLVLEYLSGYTLADVLRREKRLHVSRAVRIMQQVCRGMEAAHRMGIVHRDLKPSNIMLIEQDGDPEFAKILDFGVAKVMGDQESGVTRSGMLVGTYTCMAPEQVNNETIDARTDIYALAVMLFRMIAGRPLFAGKDFAVVLYHHVHTEAPSLADSAINVQIPRALDVLVRRCLSKDPSKRVQSMSEFERLLGECIADQTQVLPSSTAMETVVQDAQRGGMSTLLDELEPPADEDEIFSLASRSPSHRGRAESGPHQRALGAQLTQIELHDSGTSTSDEAETRSASFQLSGAEAFTRTTARPGEAHSPQRVSPPTLPPVPTSTGDISQVERLQGQTEKATQNAPALADENMLRSPKVANKTHRFLLAALGLVVAVGLGAFALLRSSTPIPASPALDVVVHPVPAPTANPVLESEPNAPAIRAATAPQAQDTTENMPKNPVEAPSEVQPQEAVSRVSAASAEKTEEEAEPESKAASSSKDDGPPAVSAEPARKGTQSKSKSRGKSSKESVAKRKSKTGRTRRSSSPSDSTSTAPSTKESPRPSFIRVRTGNE